MSPKFSALFVAVIASAAWASTPVLTRSYDNGRTGANMDETKLTPQAVGSKGLKRIKSLKCDAEQRLEAQPLYVPNVMMKDGKSHNVMFVATMANNVCAFDTDESDVTKHLLWKTAKPLGTPFLPPENQK